jgi:large subunit ribosomal protein L10
MTKAVNVAMIDALASELQPHDSCVLIGCEAFTVEQSTTLRKKLRDKSFRMRVVKNTLAHLAFDRVGMKGLGKKLSGPSAVVFGAEGAGVAAKILVAESKTNDKLKIHGGFFEGEVLDAGGIDALSKAPGRHELLGMTLASFFGPVSDMARNMDGLLSETHGLIEALAKKRESEPQV